MKTVLITGAAQGLGKSLFDICIRNAWKVFPLIRKTADAEMLKSTGGANCHPILADLREENLMEKISSVLEVNTDSLDILINNAGFVRKIEGLLPMTGKDLDEHFATNVSGVWNCSKACLSFLKKSKKGIIINVSSRRGTFEFNTNEPYERANAYKVTKCALNMLSAVMDQEFKRDGIRIFPIHPGALKTRVAPPDADTYPDEAAQKIFDWIETINSDTPFGLYDIMQNRILPW